MLLKFRKPRIGLGEWHFVPVCSNWPEVEYSERLDTPPVSELCDKCVELGAVELADIYKKKPPVQARGMRR